MKWLWLLLLVVLVTGCGESGREPVVPHTAVQVSQGPFYDQNVWRVIDTLPETGTIVVLYLTPKGLAAIIDPARSPAE